MSSLVQVRNVPERNRRVLKERAAAEGMSLNSYLLRLIAQDVERPTVAEVLARARARAASRAERAGVSTLGVIAAAREEREQQLGAR